MANYRDSLKEWFKDFVKALIFFVFLQRFFIQGFVIEGACMEPQLRSHEKIMVNKLLYNFRIPSIGEVVVFSFPLDPKKDFIKRVVGIPGDLIEVKDGYLFRNGQKVSEPFVKEYIFGSYGPLRIPSGKICVMGDNRNNSHDSRTWGFLEIKQVKGRAEFKFWPFWSISWIKVIPD